MTRGHPTRGGSSRGGGGGTSDDSGRPLFYLSHIRMHNNALSNFTRFHIHSRRRDCSLFHPRRLWGNLSSLNCSRYWCGEN